MADDIKVVADFSDLQLMRRELVGVSKDAKSSASVFEREFSRVERQLVKSAKEAQKYYDTTLKVNRASKSASASAKVLERELNKQEKEFKQNSAAAQKFYNELLGVSNVTKSASSSASVFDRELNKIERSSKRATAAQNTFSNTSRKGMRRTEIIAQQAGFQIGDLAVQLQGGTNAAVALGQQGSQLLGFFGPAGAIAGAALAIGTGIIAPFIKAKGEVVDLNEQLEKTRGALSWLSNNEEIIKKAITDPISTASRELKNFVLDLNAIKFDELSEGFAAGIFDIISPLEYRADDLQRRYDRTVEQMEKAEERLRRAGRGEEADALLVRRQKQLDLLFAQMEALRQVSETLALGTVGEDADELQASMLKAVQNLKDAGLFTDSLREKVYSLMEQTGLSTEAVEELKEAFESLSGSLSPSVSGGRGQDPRQFSSLGLFRDQLSDDGEPSTTATKAKADPLAKLNQKIALDKKLLGVSRERQTVLRAIANSDRKYTQASIDGAVKRLEAYNKEKEALEEAAAQQQFISDTIKDGMEDAFMSMVDGTKSAKDAFKDMARMIISELYKVLVVQQMVGNFSSGGGGILGALAPIFGRASGGTVMSNKPYLVGEKGPELIVPQNRGHVMNADLTSKAMGSGEQVVINQSFNFSANGDDSVKKLIAQAAPQIANLTQKQIMDSRRRGGTMKSTFG